jgi:histidinol phosphatase-like PHP family hydrolase
MPSRRDLLILTAAGAISPLVAADGVPIRDGVPQIDCHVHVGDEVIVDQAIVISHRRGMKFGLLQHAGVRGHGFAISDDASLRAWLRSLEGKPVFKGIEAESVDWVSVFSREAVVDLDYVQADALGMPDSSGAPMHIWQDDFRPANSQTFMDGYVDFQLQRIATEPIDIFAVPTFLPASLLFDYDRLWTPKRMGAIIDAAVKNNVAREIDCRFRVPRFRFLDMAHAAGAKFAFGSNYQDAAGLGDISYCVEMYRRLVLRQQIFRPSATSKRLAANR